MKETDFARCVGQFLGTGLSDEKGASPKTIQAYKLAFVMYIEYMESEMRIKPEKLRMSDLTRENVVNFLDWLEKKGNSASTRNLRLAAIRSFVNYVKGAFPEYLSECQRILSIPVKKSPRKEVSYLKKAGVELLVSQINLHATDGQRDYLMLLLLYSLGLRVSELAGLKVKDLDLEEPASLLVHGKGNKARRVPLLSPVVAHLRNYLRMEKLDPGKDCLEPLFKNHLRQPFTRQGIAYLVNKYAAKARSVDPSLIPENLSPHKLRHTSAMEMLAAGVSLIDIRDILGHASVKTTEIYAKADEKMKRVALEKASSDLFPEVEAEWEKDSGLKEWLKSL